MRWIALAVWILIPILGFTFQPVAGWSSGRIIWTCAVAVLPIFIVLVGYHRWRRICPLAFWNQIMVRVGRPGTRRAPDWLEKRYYFVPVGIFFVGLWLRLVWTNGDGNSLALFWILLSIVAFVFGVFFTGKTWCNYICPVSFIEKIYTEPNGLRETRNSQCVKCTACKKACPDINEENGYWKEIELPSKRFAYFAYPGLVFGFYFYYYLQSGNWDYYFSGSWTNQPGVFQFAFLPGTDATTAGFFFLPLIPRAVAAAVTLAACALLSAALFSVVERLVKWFLQRRGSADVDAVRVRHITFGLAAFTAFTTFYSFAGQPTIRRVDWLPAYVSILVVLVASLFLVRKLTRTPQAFAEQSLARNIIKRWEWADQRPPKDLHDAYVMHSARTSERERAYAQVLQAYQDAVRETLASGFITRADVQRLESLRNQLQIKKTDHEKVMASLAEEDRALLADPTRQFSAEKRLQLETYGHALSRYLEGAATGTDETYLERLRQEFGVTPEEHASVFAELVEGGDALSAQSVDALRVSERATQALKILTPQSASNSTSFLRDLLRRARADAIDRLLRLMQLNRDEAATRLALQQLTSDEEPEHVAAFEVLRPQLPAKLADRLVEAHASFSQPSTDLGDVPSVLRAYTSDTNPYIRAIALYALGERGGLSEDILERTSRDEHGLVRGTAVGLRARAEDAAAGEVMLTVEKIVALQCVPLFASLEAPALEELAGSSIDASYAPDAPLCIQGETGDEVFVMLDGEATVVDGTRRDGPVLRIERAGSVLGEMAVLDSEPRSASVFASGQGGARVLRLNGDAFHTVVDSDPATAEGVIRSLARRIRTKEEKKPDTLGAI